jgi:hypothetical protein
VFVPLQQSNISNNEKKWVNIFIKKKNVYDIIEFFRFNRLQILYKKYEDYSFNLIPFNAYTMFGTTETCLCS